LTTALCQKADSKEDKKIEEKESLQPSASTDDIRNKQILCDLVC
jgi:hypothetical protein